ncbi:MAG: stage V sporulation protein AD [Firmicutes bacterium]|nr:stage V sporulation protein AD [Bacillota bacterium]
MGKKTGKQTFQFATPPVIIATGTVAGPFEGQGPLAEEVDVVLSDLRNGENSFEQAERSMLIQACRLALDHASRGSAEVDLFLAGDLLNQIISSSFTAATLGIPYLGIYGACSTVAEGLALASMILDGGFAGAVLVATSSHNATAERQYRYPTEYGGQRRPYQQWTVTGAAAGLLGYTGQGPRITAATVGKVVDMGCKDPLNLGAAMAPAAAETIACHFEDTGWDPDSFDLILTGDLGEIGFKLCREVLAEKNIHLGENFSDCGLLIYDREKQDVHAGASGCATAGLVTFGRLFRQFQRGELSRVLLVATGALHSPTSFMQGENIPCIAHAVRIEA